jgi:hypothetical protein
MLRRIFHQTFIAALIHGFIMDPTLAAALTRSSIHPAAPSLSAAFQTQALIGGVEWVLHPLQETGWRIRQRIGDWEMLARNVFSRWVDPWAGNEMGGVSLGEASVGDEAGGGGVEAFEAYIQNPQNSLANYPALINLLKQNPAVTEALLEDKALRPVFMLVLPDRAYGPLEIVNTRFAEKVGGMERLKALLDGYSVFSAGPLASAERWASDPQGPRVIVGVTDRAYLGTRYAVASNRVAYFPVGKGWLLVKGCGQFTQNERPAHYFDRTRTERYEGILEGDEARAAASASRLLSDVTDPALDAFIGYRELRALPMMDGGFNPAALEYPLMDELPALTFKWVLTPHRILKLPQLLEADPGLRNLTRRISLAVQERGESPITSASDLMLYIARAMGRSEAIKYRYLLEKESLHSQDITMAGEELDEEEFRWIRDSPLDRLRSPTRSLYKKLEIAAYMIDQVRAKGAREALIPSTEAFFDAFFASYLRQLDHDQLQEWAPSNPDANRLPDLVDQLHTFDYGEASFFPGSALEPLSGLVRRIRMLVDAEILRRSGADVAPEPWASLQMHLPAPANFSELREGVGVANRIVRDALTYVFQMYPEAESVLFKSGKLRDSVRIFLNEQDVTTRLGLELPMGAVIKVTSSRRSLHSAA